MLVFVFVSLCIYCPVAAVCSSSALQTLGFTVDFWGEAAVHSAAFVNIHIHVVQELQPHLCLKP